MHACMPGFSEIQVESCRRKYDAATGACASVSVCVCALLLFMRSGVHNPSVAALTASTVSCPLINFPCLGTQHVTGTVSNEATSDMGRED